MKKYVRFQSLNAAPCSRFEYKKLTGKDPMKENQDNTDYPGYNTMSNNGFSRWMRKEVFESSFAPCETWKEKLEIELSETAQRIEELSKEIEKHSERTEMQLALMQTQLMAMQTYANVMAMRLQTHKS